jgi:hypothetical protein
MGSCGHYPWIWISCNGGTDYKGVKMDDTTLLARWCIDSETSREYLINLKTGEIIMSREELNGNHSKNS